MAKRKKRYHMRIATGMYTVSGAAVRTRLDVFTKIMATQLRSLLRKVGAERLIEQIPLLLSKGKPGRPPKKRS